MNVVGRVIRLRASEERVICVLGIEQWLIRSAKAA